MKITLNSPTAKALIETKDATGKTFSQLLYEAMELLQEKYTIEVRAYHEQTKQESS